MVQLATWGLKVYGGERSQELATWLTREMGQSVGTLELGNCSRDWKPLRPPMSPTAPLYWVCCCAPRRESSDHGTANQSVYAHSADREALLLGPDHGPGPGLVFARGWRACVRPGSGTCKAPARGYSDTMATQAAEIDSLQAAIARSRANAAPVDAGAVAANSRQT